MPGVISVLSVIAPSFSAVIPFALSASSFLVPSDIWHGQSLSYSNVFVTVTRTFNLTVKQRDKAFGHRCLCILMLKLLR